MNFCVYTCVIMLLILSRIQDSSHFTSHSPLQYFSVCPRDSTAASLCRREPGKENYPFLFEMACMGIQVLIILGLCPLSLPLDFSHGQNVAYIPFFFCIQTTLVSSVIWKVHIYFQIYL